MRNIIFIICCLALPQSLVIADALQWHSESLTYLHGEDFKVNSKKQSTITFEHASGWNWGDLFVFMDATRYHNSTNGDGFYGEFSPRFSLSKFSDRSIEVGFIKDISIATTIEFGRGDVQSFLIGPGFDLDIPYFDYFNMNIYKRIASGDRDGDSIQITPVWSISTPFLQSDLIFKGFIDWNIQDDGQYSKNLHFNPQLQYDLGKRINLKNKQLLVGFEYSYWKNKYGIKDSPAFSTDQSVLSFLIQSNF